MTATQLLIGGENGHVHLELRYANRHGLIAGATGTGKTVTLQCLAEGFSSAGVPVFVADIKGDLSGISQPGKPHPKVDERVNKLSLTDFKFEQFPTAFWDVFGDSGLPVRATISDMGPGLLSRLMDLNDTQTGVLTLAFEVADDNGLLLLDLKDLRAILQHVTENAADIKKTYGNVSASSVGAIMRSLLELERENAELFFAEPAFDTQDLLRTDGNSRGIINVLAADKLIHKPKLYATFLLWLLSDIYEGFPEIGDQDKPKLVFFFDEAHLLFDDAPKALVDKIEQVVRLIRSKGVGIYFITQNPLDIPESVLGQLGNRVQHALRAYTPKDQKAVRAAATTFRANPDLDTEKVITELGVGEALVSVLMNKAEPSIVQRVLIRPPHSQIGPINGEQRRQLINGSELYGKYKQSHDRASAYEELQQRAAKQALVVEEPKKTKKRASNRQSVGEALVKSVVRSIGSSLGRQIIRGILGSLGKR